MQIVPLRRPHRFDGDCDGPQSEDSEIRRRRLLFRSWHRGTRELDLLVGSFAEAPVADFDDAQLDRFEALLDCADADLFDWITGRRPVPAAYDHDVMRLLRSSRYGQKG